MTPKIEVHILLDKEWILLMMLAKHLGLNLAQVRHNLQELRHSPYSASVNARLIEAY
ncbi:hypothetical protein GCM10025859_16970 [Alicyclobacillus fastidiosus]|nr:hypothetical protein GCM10025859_16970 [Alicyclobacillus fastidiosus]